MTTNFNKDRRFKLYQQSGKKSTDIKKCIGLLSTPLEKAREMGHLSGKFPEPDSRVWQRWLNGLLSPCCVLCGLPSPSVCLCYPCKMDLPWINAHCRQCGLPLETESVESCGQCCQEPPPYWSVASPLVYEFPVNRLVQALKFRRQLAEGRVLSHLMAEYIYHQELDLPDVLIPVPLHRWRMLKRGFNQAFELADHIARTLGVRLDATSLRRHRYTRAQSGLSRKQRLNNVQNAFQWHADRRACRHVALIDDVMTTGTTVTECARILLNAGAKRVDIWVAARAAAPAKPGPAKSGSVKAEFEESGPEEPGSGESKHEKWRLKHGSR